MSGPFVVSMKFTSDASGVKASTGEIRQGLGQVRQSATEAAQALGLITEQQQRMKAINASLGVRDEFQTAQRAADIAAYGREMDDLRAKYNPLFALEQRRAAAIDDIHRAQRLGAISAQEMTTAVRAEEAAYQRQVAAINASTDAMLRNQVAGAKDNRNSFQTANIAAQFQDIAVTSTMGMSPLQIALQQGTQLSSVLGGQGLTGVVRTLGAAFASVLSPVSLLTIGAVALSAAAIQAFGSLFQEAESATDALDRHNDELDDLLAGYDRVRDAAQNAFDAAIKAPEGVVVSDLKATLREQEEAETELQRRIMENRAFLTETVEFIQSLESVGNSVGDDTTGLESASRQIALMRDLAIDTASTRVELEAAAVAARELYNTTDDDALKEMADQAYQLAMELLGIRAAADSASAALNAMPRDIQIKISMSQEFGSALTELQGLYQDPRSRFDQMREQAKNAADQAQATAVSYGAAVGAAAEFERVMNSIDAAESQANAKKAASAAKAAEQKSDYERAIESIQERTRAQELEAKVIGLSAYATEKARVALELENAARQDAIGLSQGRIAQIDAEAAAYARVTAALDRQQSAHDALSQTVEQTIDTTVDSLLDSEGDILDTIANIGKQWAKLLLEMAVSNPLKNALLGQNNPTLDDLGGILSGLLTGILGGVPTRGAGGITGGARGAVRAGTGHTGAMIGSSPTARYVDTSLFNNAPRHHTGTDRLRPGEVPFIGMEGEEIGWPSQLAAKYGSKIDVTVNDYSSGVSVSAEQEDDGKGGRRLNLTLNDAMATEISRPNSRANIAGRTAGRVVRRS